MKNKQKKDPNAMDVAEAARVLRVSHRVLSRQGVLTSGPGDHETLGRIFAPSPAQARKKQ
jgi:hypothetical protein